MNKFLLFSTIIICVVYGYDDLELPPFPPRNHAKVARNVVHKSNWASIGSISSDPRLKGFPMVTLISIADSAVGAPSTGHIYFMLTDQDFTGKDWNIHNNVTLLLSNDEDLTCTKRGMDTMEPTCSRVIIAGNVIKLKPSDADYAFAKYNFFSRHPAGKKWIHVHNFYLAEFNISTIFVVDWYGGPHQVTRDDYFKSTTYSENEINGLEYEDKEIKHSYFGINVILKD
ncbi:CREG1 family protein [Megaselia abdita]